MRLNSVLLLACFLQCAGAQPRIGHLTLGYAYDPDLLVIRPVVGIPGASVLGEPIEIGFRVSAAAIAPGQDYALAVSAADGKVRLIRWSTEGISTITLAGAIELPDRFAFSTSGRAAILYDSQSGRMQALTGLPGDPSVHDSRLSGSIDAIAISDDATIALAAGPDVRVIRPDLNSFPLPIPASVAALAFDTSNRDLLAATRSGDLYLSKNLDSNLVVTQVYSGDSQTSGPAGVQFSPDGSAAFLANSDGVLTRIDLNTGAAIAMSCGCAPVALLPFGRPGLFRLTEISNRPISLFDGAPIHPRFWFVPADAERSAQ